MQIQLNIRPDTPNINGVIFPKETLVEAIKHFNEEKIGVVTYRYGYGHETHTPLDSIIAVCDGVTSQYPYQAEIRFLQTDEGERFKKLLADNPDHWTLLIKAWAEYDETTKIVGKILTFTLHLFEKHEIEDTCQIVD